MPKKYHIHIKETLPRFHPVGKFTTVEFREDCAGSCRECVKKKCVYNVFENNYLNMLKIKEPQYLYACESCFRCVQECTRGIFSRVINPDYARLGDGYWTPDIIHQTWMQAQTGRVPVSGAGYGGPFTGRGFDAMWTDMSEIVRPTRDGIHGREYINTSIELTRRPHHLQFNSTGLGTEEIPVLEVPLPLMFKKPEFGVLSRSVLNAMAAAAGDLGTLMFIKPEDYDNDLEPYISNIVPCLDRANYEENEALIKNCRMIEIACAGDVAAAVAAVKAINPAAVISIGIELDSKAAERAVELAGLESVDTLHFYADADGNELNT
ncbi:MAG: hypothetical protein JW954_06865, partial [Dehalococcoidaceae bacterium]|nr:hypothetical protein [Dehalococcoidaceae bacterium]